MDMERPRPARLLGHLAFTAAAAFAAVAALYLILLAKLVFTDGPGRVCGIDSCPRGTGSLALLAPLCAAAAWLLWRTPRKRGRGRTPVHVRVIAVCVALAASAPGWLGFEYARGPHMDLSGWQEAVHPAAAPVGVWAPARGMLVRARTDGLVAYNGEGRKGWRLPAPERTPLCALSRTIPSGIGLLTYGESPGACGSQVVAVDLADGHVEWTRDAGRALVAAAGASAVVADRDTVTGLDLRSGAERWRVPIPADCTVKAVDGSEQHALYVEECGDSARITAVDSRTGTRAWQTALPTASRLREVRVLSAVPPVVRVTETAERGMDAVLLFDAGGRLRGFVPASGPAGDLLSEPSPVLTGDLMITSVKEGKNNGVSAYSLTDGRRVWHAGVGDEVVRGLAPTGPGEVGVVTADRWRTYLAHHGLADGRRRAQPTVLRDLPLGERFTFYPGPPGSYVFVNLDRKGLLPPTFDIDPVFGW
ncbi:PQQ-binding-like beta-propeller repeat protein [Streptomyces virginiae]|uniref:outer membrane protein assembly factor BamB family protein n=2 Tax=Streptomyces virginiae TaxID=1961 RepID=UPI002E2CADDE|nr:PQQ-binding-like beta-propeller repeat protein [Streptomyces virginiae]